jgi:nucleoside-triphosphatase THEP1
MKIINILTGPVQSGKTTHLIAWVKFHTRCAGILSPLLNNKRFIYSIHTNEYRPLETEVDLLAEQEKISIGKYSFLQSSFTWAQQQLKLALDMDPKWLIIDEIGPLELSGKGLEPMVGKILKSYKSKKKYRLVIVVRENLLDKVIRHYDLQGKYSVDRSFLSVI